MALVNNDSPAPENEQENKKILLRAVQSVVAGAGAITPADMALEFVEAKITANVDMFERMRADAKPVEDVNPQAHPSHLIHNEQHNSGNSARSSQANTQPQTASVSQFASRHTLLKISSSVVLAKTLSDPSQTPLRGVTKTGHIICYKPGQLICSLHFVIGLLPHPVPGRIVIRGFCHRFKDLIRCL